MRVYAQLNSSAIREASYDEDERRLEVVFHSGRRYTMDDVPLNIFEGLRDASSAGQYFNDNIKGRYA